MKNRLLLPLLPIILWSVSMGIAHLYTYLVNNGEIVGFMDISTATIIAAVIAAVIGALVTLIVSFLPERRRTETILKKLEGISSEAQIIPPVKEDTAVIRRNVTEIVVPRLDATKDIADGVKSLVADLNYRKGVRSESSFRTQDALKAGMDAVFEENARLNKIIKEQAEEIGSLKAKNQELEIKNRTLGKQLSSYKKQERSRSDIDRDER